MSLTAQPGLDDAAGTRPDPAAMSAPSVSAPSVSVTSLESPVGRLRIVAGPTGLRTVSWSRSAEAASGPPGPFTERTVDQLGEYFAGTRRHFDVAIDLSGLESTTRAVLEALCTIAYGSTITYGELARFSGTGLPARAIGAVMGSNPVPLVVPCHRVVAGDGLGGYSGGEPGRGPATKRWLLEHEGALPPTLI
jgi:methylated-DNA-[protein]-cysteine S-methyltransferase